MYPGLPTLPVLYWSCVNLPWLLKMLMFAAGSNARVHSGDLLSEHTTYCINGGSTSSEVAIREALVAQGLGHDGTINAAYHAKAVGHHTQLLHTANHSTKDPPPPTHPQELNLAPALTALCVCC
jgi:hypothetical protein